MTSSQTTYLLLTFFGFCLGFMACWLILQLRRRIRHRRAAARAEQSFEEFKRTWAPAGRYIPTAVELEQDRRID